MLSLNTHRHAGLILKPVGKCSLTGDTRVQSFFSYSFQTSLESKYFLKIGSQGNESFVLENMFIYMMYTLCANVECSGLIKLQK